ncbi:MAG: HEAT repeat domain-containing protein [Cyanobacteria bacterium P01_G01_bin.54]
MDLVLTPLVFTALGAVAKSLIEDTCQDYLKTKLLDRFTWLEQLGQRDIVERSYQDAMEQAYGACLEMLLTNIKGCGYSDAELKEYDNSLKKFISDERVAAELWAAVQEPNNIDLPSPDVLGDRWRAIGGLELPSESLWSMVALAFRRQAKKQIHLNDQLRELYNAQTLDEMRKLIERQGGVKIQVRREKYAQRMRLKYSPVDLANLMPAYADDPGRLVIRDVFVSQTVRENPPPVELPKDLAARLRKAKATGSAEDVEAILDAQQLEAFRTTYVNQSPQPVLDVIAAPTNRLVVLTGEPGSGKSTLMRYLLTGVIEPPKDKQGEPLPWTEPFREVFPLLIELREFYALRQRDECDSFLDYVAYMGKTQQWFLDDHAVEHYLETSPSLVMFDGLDEIFDGADRERVMHEIAGFAQRYSKARIVVTSRPVGYREQILRNGGFGHFGIQDLGNTQIKTFIEGWFALTFPQNPQARSQRIERIMGSIEQSKSIRLLAGNPMLLTIMALLAREEELPRERAKFYEKAVEVLCHHWDVNRNLQLTDGYLNADDKKALLRRVALRMQAGEGGLKGNFITEDDLEQEIQGFLLDEQWQTDGAAAKKAARRIIQQLRERNYILCLRGPQLYGFVHRTFLEYLTASAYVVQFEKQRSLTFEQLRDEIFGQHWQDEAWHEVLCLICGAIDVQFTGSLIEFLMNIEVDRSHYFDDPRDYRPFRNYLRPEAISNLTLAAEIIAEVKNRTLIKLIDRDLLRRFQYEIDHQSSTPLGTGAARVVAHRFTQTWLDSKDLLQWLKAGVEDHTDDEDWYWYFFVRSAVYVIAEMGHDDPDILQWLKNLVIEGHSDWGVCESAVCSIVRHWRDEPETLPWLQELAESHDLWAVRRGAIESLAQYWQNDPKTLPLVLQVTRLHGNWGTRHAGVEMLERYWSQHPDIIEIFCGIIINDPGGETGYLEGDPRCEALKALLKYYNDHPRTFEMLHYCANDDRDLYLQEWAQEQLEKFESNEIQG